MDVGVEGRHESRGETWQKGGGKGRVNCSWDVKEMENFY